MPGGLAGPAPQQAALLRAKPGSLSHPPLQQKHSQRGRSAQGGGRGGGRTGAGKWKGKGAGARMRKE